MSEEGVEMSAELEDFHARVFSHELEHLEGSLFFEWEVSEGDVVTDPEEFYFFHEVGVA